MSINNTVYLYDSDNSYMKGNVDMEYLNKLIEENDEEQIFKYFSLNKIEEEVEEEVEVEEEEQEEEEDVEENKNILNDIVKLLKNIPENDLNDNGIYIKEDKVIIKEKNNCKMPLNENDKKMYSKICNKSNCKYPKPIKYNNCNVPKCGFKKGWSGPSYWPFSNGLPYNSTF